MVVISTGTNLLLPPCCYKVSSHQWTHVDSNTHTLPASSAIPKMTWMCIDSKTWSISWHRRRGRTHTHAMHIGRGYRERGRENKYKSIRVAPFFLLLLRMIKVEVEWRVVFFPENSVPFPYFSSTLRGLDIRPYFASDVCVCVCVCIYHPCLFVYVYITTVRSAVIMEKSPTDEIPFPKLLFRLYIYFPLFLFVFRS